MFKSRQDADAVFDKLDGAQNGAISREQFEDWCRQQRDPGQMKMAMDPYARPSSPPMPSAQTKLYGVIADDLSEEVRLMKDTRRAFALAGPVLICILAFMPFSSSLALLNSRTYLYFSGWSTPLGGIMIFTVIAVGAWMSLFMGVGCPGIPISNPFRTFGPLWDRMKLIPTEAYIVMAVTIALMFVWKLVPVLMVGGFEAGVSWTVDLINVFKAVWFTDNAPGTVLASAIAAVALYVLSLNYFFARAKPEARNSSMSLFAIWSVFVLFMGASFMLLSVPISYEADKANSELMIQCETGPRTRDLYVTSQALQSLRQSEMCAKYVTIEDCPGYQPTVYTRVLKSMEADFKCAGFCYNPALLTPLNGPQPAYTPGGADTFEYPPSLYSLANYQASCDGMAARSMQHFVGVIGTQIFHQGAICVIVAILMSMFFLLSVCGGYREKEGWLDADGHAVKHPGYGSI